MSSPSPTLQCRQCSGVFATPKVATQSYIKCPHCATAAPLTEFAAIEGSPPQQEPEPAAGSEPTFKVRGKWLQFDCPHCVRPMRLIAEDAGGLVDCAHCGLELVAPDPAIGRGATLSRASEGRVGSISRFNQRDLRRDQLEQSKPADQPEAFDIFEKAANQEDESSDDQLDPNHALARSAAAAPVERRRAVKALGTDKLGKSFRRQEVIAQRELESRENDWAPRPTERPSFGESRLDRYGFWIALGVAAAVMVGIVLMVIGEAGKSGEVFDDGQMSEIQVAQREQASSFQASFEMAKEALASPTWEALVPNVRNSERVAPLMRSFYSRETYSPIELKDFHAPLKVDLAGMRMHEMRVNETDGHTRTLVIQATGAGAKIDWELMVNLPRYEWAEFLEDRPSDLRTVRVIASHSSVLDKYFRDAGLDRDQGAGYRLWHGDADGYYTVVANDTEIGKALAAALDWEKGRKIVIKASFDPDSELNDRIRIESLVQTGWIIE